MKEKGENRDLAPREPRAVSVWDAIDQMLSERFFEPFETSLFQRRALFPKIDLTENEKEIVVQANVPGIDPDEIDVRINEDSVSSSGTISKEKEEGQEDEKLYRYEREYGTFQREIPLPGKVDPSKARAESENGVLSITLPKSGASRSKKLKISRKK